MEYALIGGIRTAATARARGICPQCSGEVIAKCGQIVIHHWAHVSGDDCDPWSEPETLWHRYWKSFGAKTEVTIGSHRADIVTIARRIVELQHSGISVDEIRAREAEYGSNLRWLFDGTNLTVNDPDGYYLVEEKPLTERQLKRQQEILEREIAQSIADGIEIVDDEEGIYTSKLRTALDLRWKDGKNSIVTFRWKHPRLSYAYCTQPVYIDLPGDEYVLKLGKLHLNGPPYGGWGKLYQKQQIQEFLR